MLNPDEYIESHEPIKPISEVLLEAAKAMAESGEPIAVTESKFLAKRQAMIEDLKRAIEQGKIVFPQDTRWLEHDRATH